MSLKENITLSFYYLLFSCYKEQARYKNRFFFTDSQLDNSDLDGIGKITSRLFYNI